MLVKEGADFRGHAVAGFGHLHQHLVLGVWHHGQRAFGPGCHPFANTVRFNDAFVGAQVAQARQIRRRRGHQGVHFAQGFVPAIVARELVIRLEVFNSVNWRNFFIVCLCLAISAFYELIEWWVALVSAEAADSFLGTQGYVWDTQSDMAWALSGAVMALAVLGRMHDRQLRERGFVAAV